MSAHWEITPITLECGSGRHVLGDERLAPGTPVCRTGGGRLVRCRRCAEHEGYTFDAEAIAAAQALRDAQELDRAFQPAMLPGEASRPPMPARTAPVARGKRRPRPTPRPATSSSRFDPRRAAANDYD